MVSPLRSPDGSRSPASSAVLIAFSLATLLEVTSGGCVLARRSTPAVTAIVAVADKDDPDDGKSDDDDDAAKMQQPVRVGDLIGRAVIAPVERQDLIGHVTKLVRHGDDLTIVMTYGGHLGFGTHLICVPADALALTGTALQAKDISPDDLAALPPCDGSGDAAIDATTTIKMKLAKPAH